jgi:hypothetical protein
MRRTIIPAATTALAVLPALAARAQQLPSTVYVWTMGNTDQNSMMASLAGIVNRNTSGEVLLSPNNHSQPNPLFWLDQLRLAYPQVQSQVQSNPTFFINQYRSQLAGYVLYDKTANPDSLNVATSIAGVTDSIIVDSNTLAYATAAGLPMTADARTMTYAQAYQQYAPQFNKSMIFHQDTGKDHQLRDYAVMNRGFMYYTSPTTNLGTFAANQNHQGRVYGWAQSEFDLFSQASQRNQMVVASDWSGSNSTTSRWQIPLATQQYHTPGNISTNPGKHYVAFVMSDGDNEQWLTNGFATDPKWYGSQYRGNFNMTWDLTSTLGEMNPVAFNYLYQHASNGTKKDNFVSAGGAGIAFPSQYPDINGLASSINSSMQTADQKVVSILDPAYSTSKLYPILDQPQVDGMMFKTYDSYYKGRNGAIEFHNGKPIVSVEYSLWDGPDTAQGIANALSSDPNQDPIDDVNSYSIINVNPWSVFGPTGSGSSGNPMSNLNWLVQQLEPSRVEVVTLEELMVQLRNHFGTPLPGYIVNATWIRDANGTWGTRSNWTGALPNGIDATANFGTVITGLRAVTVASPVTVGTISFDNAGASYLINGTGTITMDVSSGAAGLNVLSGNHVIAAPIALNDDLLVNVVPASGILTASGTLSATGRSITKAGAGTVRFPNVRAAALNVNAGTVAISANGTSAGASRVNTLSINGGAAPTASLDLNDNDLVITSGSYATTTAQIAAARHGGAWDGQGITSSSARTQPQHATTLGLLMGDQFASAGGTTFDGFNVAGSDLLVKYTWYGDTDFNGVVNFDDYVRTDAGFNTAGTDWFHGDFDLNGVVNFDDYVLIDLAFNTQSGTLRRALSYLDGSDRSERGMDNIALAMVERHFRQFGDVYANHLLTAVPEPCALIVPLVALGLPARRRRLLALAVDT